MFLSAGTGTKNPTFVERFGFTPDTFIGNPNLRPERSRSYSVSLEHAVRRRRCTCALPHSTTGCEDEINGFFFDANAGGFTAVNTNGESQRDGVELSVHAQLNDVLRVRIDYTYLDATQPGERKPGERTAPAAEQRPRHRRLRRAAGAADVADRRGVSSATTTTTTSQRFPARRVNLDGYTLLHCTARYRINDMFEITGRVENAADEHYQDVFGLCDAGAQRVSRSQHEAVMKPFERMIGEVWDDSIVPTLCRYIEIPNKSPMFDADWHSHGYMRDAVNLLEDWCRRSAVKGSGSGRSSSCRAARRCCSAKSPALGRCTDRAAVRPLRQTTRIHRLARRARTLDAGDPRRPTVTAAAAPTTATQRSRASPPSRRLQQRSDNRCRAACC